MTSTEDGGVITFHNADGTLSVTGCNFTEYSVSTSFIHGGAIFVVAALPVSIETTKFDLYQSEDVYGDEFAVNHTTTVTLDMITCNKCEVLAPTVIDCRGGGGMINHTATLIITNTQFIDCISDTFGGGHTLYNISSSAAISCTSFTSCQSKGTGGSLGIADCQLSLKDDGGGLSVINSNKIVIDICEFISYTAPGTYKDGGGPFFHTVDAIEVEGSKSEDCMAFDGFCGGTSFEGENSLSVTGSNFM
ncbi:hypothetical protein BLNAU_21976 [Blattamonas nauphoetae]|uniref:Right handed beta helix domain-containing protein n=1 Tax=Blattamonas nauphoetae TaxID=2049346 RepID=A0ABQ9WUU3_9EUKA|nr:hypothetical protein BLNAU_21976 [Blattamonas nauphoetae]